MSPERFDALLEMVEPLVRRKRTNFREPISPAERLSLTLRFLATGESQQSLSFSFRMGKTTVSNIVSETCDAIYSVLSPQYLSPPSKDGWLIIAQEFEEVWNLPNVIGALDGKHIRITCPLKTGTQYHNYKVFFSMQFLAMCDARYNFILFDIGDYGSNNDTGVLKKSLFGKKFASGTMNIPDPRSVQGCRFDPLPYYVVGDEIFPLKTWIMRPYPGQLSEEQKVFNYRLSRARRVIENAFGILCTRFRIFYVPINACVANIEKYAKAAIALHNYLRQTENALYCPQGFVDSESSIGEILPGNWRSIRKNSGLLHDFSHIRGSRCGDDAKDMPEALKEYVNSPTGELSWQLHHVRPT